MLIPVILAGGADTLLWPISRQGVPKPFLQLADGQSLLLKTFLRAAAVARGGQMLTTTSRDSYFMGKDELAKARWDDAACRTTFLLEPFGRNTAAAVILSAFMVAEQFGRDACLLVLPADHLVQRQQAFAQAVTDAETLARQGRLVTFGVVPSSPETGFGYIEAGTDLAPGRSVLRFVEKPDSETAKDFVESGNFYWNTGMFCFLAGTVLDAFALHAPDIFQTAEACWQHLRHMNRADPAMYEIPAEPFTDFPDISIDHALLERSTNLAIVPADFDWNDIGSWDAVSHTVGADGANNRSIGRCLFFDSRDTFAQSEERLVATIGVDNLIIVDTADALLVVHSARVQDVKTVVNLLKNLDHDTYKLHRTVFKPWGTYTVLEEGPGFKIKRITVKPGASLSLQLHHYRSEHWIVVDGMAKVVNGDREMFIAAKESIHIPAGREHRVENPGILDLVLIEVQSGEYLGEDDIVRLQDKYGRCA